MYELLNLKKYSVLAEKALDFFKGYSIIVKCLIIKTLTKGKEMSDDRLTRAVEMMIRTDHMHRHLIDSRASELGIHRTQHRILMKLARHDKLLSQKELADWLDVTPAAVTVALRKLERDGYVEKALGRDNRYNEVSITEKGRALVDRTRELFSATDKSLFEGFTKEELEHYIASLEKLEANIRGQMSLSFFMEK